MELNSWMKTCFNVNSQENEQIPFFSKETCEFQVLGNNTLIIAGYKAIKLSIFHKLDVKLWLRDDDLRK